MVRVDRQERTVAEEPQRHGAAAILDVAVLEPVFEAEGIDEWRSQAARDAPGTRGGHDVRPHRWCIHGLGELLRWVIAREPWSGDRERGDKRREREAGAPEHGG
jgi:hypothetical protein